MLFRLIVSNLAKGIRKTAMTYYKDLTPYEYFARHEPPVLRGERMLTTLNVGWLSGNKSYSKGETSQEFKDTLFQLCLDEYIVNIARGFHVCELCRDISYEQSLGRIQCKFGFCRYYDQRKMRINQKAFLIRTWE